MFHRFGKTITRLLPKFNENALYIVLYLILPLIGFWRNLDMSEINLRFFHVDFIGYYFPDYLQGVQIVRDILHGKPISDSLWDPYNFLGFPLIGAVDRVGIFYPVRLLFYFISSFFSIKYQVFFATYYSLFHMSLAGIFTYFLVKNCLKLSPFSSFVAGIIYSLGGSFIYVSIFTNVVPGLACLPLQLYLLFKAFQENSFRRAMLAGLAASPIFLSGYTQTFIYNNLFISLFLLLYFVRSRKNFLQLTKFLIIANVVTVLISMVVFLPSLEVKLVAHRQLLNLVGSSAHSFNAEDLMNYFVPYLYGIDKGGTVFGYVGIVSLILIYLALQYSKTLAIRIFVFLAFLFFTLSLANKTFLHEVVYNIIPFYSNFRFHAFMQYLVGFSLAVIAGYGIDIIEKKKITSINISQYGKILVWLFLIPYLFTFFMRSISPNVASTAMMNEMVNSIFISMIFAIASFFLFRYVSEAYHKYFRILLILILLIDLFTLVGRNAFANSDYDPRVFITKSEPVAQVVADAYDAKARMYMGESTLRFNSAPEKISQISGFHSLAPERYTTLIDYYAKKDQMVPTSTLFDMLSAKYIFSTKLASTSGTIKLLSQMPVSKSDYGRFLTASGEKVPEGTPIYTYENLNYLPRVYNVQNWKKATSNNHALSLIDTIDIQNTAIVTTKNDLPQSQEGDAQMKTTLEKYQNSYIKVKTNSLRSSLLVLTDLFYPGWEAYVDGKKTDIYVTNIALRGVFLNAGEHTIEFRYRPKGLFAGMSISGVSLVVFLSILIKKRVYSL